MSRDEAERLLGLSRQARWTFPSSFGRPVGDEPDDAVERLVAEREALVEAARFFVDEGEPHAAMELAANVWRVWMLSRDEAGGRAFLAPLLEGGDPAPSRTRALALYGDGLLALRLGSLEESRERSEAALANARGVDDPEALALSHLGLSRIAFEDGDYDRTRALASAARVFARSLAEAMSQAPLHLHAQSTRLAGDYDGAAELLAESLALNRRLGDRGMVAVELHNLGHVELHRGHTDAAARLFAECAQLEADDDPYGAAMRELNEAAVAFATGELERARAGLDSADSILEESGTEPASDDRFELDWLRGRLGAAERR